MIYRKEKNKPSSTSQPRAPLFSKPVKHILIPYAPSPLIVFNVNPKPTELLCYPSQILHTLHITVPEIRSSLQIQSQTQPVDVDEPEHVTAVHSPKSTSTSTTQGYIAQLVDDVLRSQGLSRTINSEDSSKREETLVVVEQTLGLRGKEAMVRRVEEMIERGRSFSSLSWILLYEA